VTGGTTAKVMVAAMGNEWGKKFYQGTLTRNIAGVIYKVSALQPNQIKSVAECTQSACLCFLSTIGCIPVMFVVYFLLFFFQISWFDGALAHVSLMCNYNY
jgi:hypothetical protein